MPNRDGEEINGTPNSAVRRSLRETKRPKFDDELVQSIPLVHPRKRTLDETMLIDTEEYIRPRKRLTSRATTSQSGSNSQQISPIVPSMSKNRSGNGGLSSHSTPTASTSMPGEESNDNNQNLIKQEEIKQEVEAPPNPLVNERKRKERIANKIQVTKEQQISVNQHVNHESMKRWTAEDDLALVAGVTHTCDLRQVYTMMNFSKKYDYEEIEERWYELLYVDDISRLAKKRMENVNREKSLQIQSKIPLNTEEENLLCSIPSNTIFQNNPIFEKLYEQNRAVWHFARNPKILEEMWRERKFYGLLCDQKPVIEQNLDMNNLIEGHLNDTGLDVDMRNMTRNVVTSEREVQEWEKVIVSAIRGVNQLNQMAPDTVAVLRGRTVTYDIRKDQALIGRSTRKHRVDVNLTLEGPSARISRIQAMMKLYENGDFLLHNLGNRPIYVDGKSIIKGERAQLQNNSVIEIGLILLHFTKNPDAKAKQHST